MLIDTPAVASPFQYELGLALQPMPAPSDGQPQVMGPRATPTTTIARHLSLVAANDPDARDLAWAAGFVDGEGCILLSVGRLEDRPHPNIRPVLSVSQNRRDVLEELIAITKVPAPIYVMSKQARHRRQCWTCSWQGKGAIAVLRMLRPYFRRKGPEADVCFRYEREGQMSKPSGPKGHPEALWRFRLRLVQELRDLK